MNSKQQLIQHCQQYLDHYYNSRYMRKYSVKFVEWVVKVVSGSILATNTEITTKIIEAEYTAMIWDANPFNVRLFDRLISAIIDDSIDTDEDDDSVDEVEVKNNSIFTCNPYRSTRVCDISDEELIPLVPQHSIFLLKKSDGILIIKVNGTMVYVGKLNGDYTIDPPIESNALHYSLTIMGDNGRSVICKRITENLDNSMVNRIKANVTNPDQYNLV